MTSIERTAYPQFRRLTSARVQHLAGHQACLAHLVRDFQDAAETYPDAIWPAQASGPCAA